MILFPEKNLTMFENVATASIVATSTGGYDKM